VKEFSFPAKESHGLAGEDPSCKKMAMIFQRAEFLWKNSASRKKRRMDFPEKRLPAKSFE